MKPRNKREREVVELSSKLPPISNKQKEWAKEHVFAHEAFKCKDELWCSDCGKFWVNSDFSELSATVIGEEVECPYCHHKLKVKVSRKQKTEDVKYMTIVSLCGDYQVLRHIYCEKFTRKEGSNKYNLEAYTYYYFNEVVQEWINVKGKRTVIARPMNMGSTGWLYNTGRSIKQEYGSSYYYQNQYAIHGAIYPRVHLLEELKKRGLNKKLLDMSAPSDLIQGLLKGHCDFELCIKTKQYDMFRYISGHGYYQLQYKPSFNICNRNHYIIKDASMWSDYIELLLYFNKDIRNAKFICPKNLKKEHDILLKRKAKKEAEERRVRERERAILEALDKKEAILKFYQQKEKFFGMEIKDNGIVIHPLESITQFYLEAKAMHHCVFRAGYYKKPDCLILSARDSNGNRLETIEINLKTLSIIQSRAVYNGQTKRHDDIINLVKNNINIIKKRLTA